MRRQTIYTRIDPVRVAEASANLGNELKERVVQNRASRRGSGTHMRMARTRYHY